MSAILYPKLLGVVNKLRCELKPGLVSFRHQALMSTVNSHHMAIYKVKVPSINNKFINVKICFCFLCSVLIIPANIGPCWLQVWPYKHTDAGIPTSSAESYENLSILSLQSL